MGNDTGLRFIDHEAHPYEEPDNQWLAKNYAPVRKTWRHEPCRILEGEVPEGLKGGQYIRNGPNPQWEQNGRPYHWFDGDGMLHGVYFSESGPTYVNRFVLTQRLAAEKQAGGPYYPNIGQFISNKTSTVLRGLAGATIGNFLNAQSSVSNTALTYHNRRLLSLLEAEAPKHVMAPDLNTVGDYRFANDALGEVKKDASPTDPSSSQVPGRKIVTAHPKVCPKTGNMYFFGYNMQAAPYVCYSASDAKGNLFVNTRVVPDCKRPVMMHDMQITDNWAIVFDMPLVLDPSRVKDGNSALFFDKSQKSKFHLIPRETGGSAAYSFETEPCMIFHSAVAYEDGDDVVLIACRSGDPNIQRKEHIPESDQFLTEFRFNLRTNKTTQRRLCEINGEFPMINPEYLTRKSCRYVYFSKASRDYNGTIFRGLVKVDLQTGQKSEFDFPEGLYHGEAVFAPRSEAHMSELSEDDGYLITFASSNTANPTNHGQLYVINSKTMELECVLEMPARVPYGFHGFWMSKSAIEHQTRDVPAEPVKELAWKDWALSKVMRVLTQ